MLQDYKLGLRMLVKYPGLTVAGGLALAIAIGIGAGWYDLAGKLLWPTIPLPDGDRIVVVETQNTLTADPEARVAHDFLEWRRDLKSIGDLGAFRTNNRNLIVGNAPPVVVQTAELTATAFGLPRVPPLLGRALLDSDERPGAPSVLVLGYNVWQRSFRGRPDVIGSTVKLGNSPATVIGVMPEGFRYPVSHDAWTALQLRASYGALEGDPIDVIGKLAPGVMLEQANVELRVIGERAAVAFPATHEHLLPRALRLGRGTDIPPGIAELAITYLPSLLVLLLACTTVGTLIYARTAIREGEIALRSALGASRARIVGQLFVEALVLAVVAAVAGLLAADRTLRWGIESAYVGKGGAPFWMTTGLELTTMLYAAGLAAVSAAMLSLLPALRVTRARLQSHLANTGAGGGTLRFGRVWTTALITQVALTAITIPGAIEGASQTIRAVRVHTASPSREYFAARLALDRPADEEASASDERRNQAYTRLQQRIVKEPGAVAVTLADRAPGASLPRFRTVSVEVSSGAAPAFDIGIATSAVGPGFFEVFDRPIVAGRAFNGGDFGPAAGVVIVNEAFVRGFIGRVGNGSPLGARLRYAGGSTPTATDPWFEIVGVVRDLGFDPDEQGEETSFVFHPAPAATLSPLVMSVRWRGNAAVLASRLPVIAADLDAGLSILEARPLAEWIWRRDLGLVRQVGALFGVTMLVLLLSSMGIFALMSVSVSRRTREIGVRAALGAHPRHVLAGIIGRALLLMGSGIVTGGALVLFFVAIGGGPTGRPADDLVTFSAWLGVTSAVMLAAALLACVEPARRALRISPVDALRDA
jgi:predicted permease